jgi:LPS-assembly protein
MDVEIRSRDVPVSKAIVFKLLAVLFFISSSLAVAEETLDSAMHSTADKTLWNRKDNQVELIGRAVVRQTGETLNADHIWIDLTTRDVRAVGNVVYISPQALIHAEELTLNLATRVGTIIGGRVSNEAFTLTGERINRLGEKRFQTLNGSYSTCRDCPQSWTLEGTDVDLEIEGYAKLTNAVARIKDSPILWFPYLVVPIKSERQSGFLFPRFGFSNTSLRYIQPFFWAISRSADMTIAAGDSGDHGLRLEWEGRYQLTERSGAVANFYYLRDNKFYSDRKGQSDRATPNRWALSVLETQELPLGFEQKLRVREVRDNRYPTDYGDIHGDLPASGESTLSSDLILQQDTSLVSSYAAMKRTRNLLYSDPFGFDPDTVQVYPSAGVIVPERSLFGTPVFTGLALGVTHFGRTGAFYDRDLYTPVTGINPDFRPGIDPLRKATRLSYSPTVYTSVRPWDKFTFIPSAQYRGFNYFFEQSAPNLNRGYLQLRGDLSTQFERIYETENPEVPRMKHLIRPEIGYSLIPMTHESSLNGGATHPFLGQMSYAQERGFSGYNFDNYDIVPRDSSNAQTNYFVPEGNALSYGLTSQLIRRKGNMASLMPSYQTSVELTTKQSFNFRSRHPGGDQKPLSRWVTSLGLEFDQWSSRTDYTYVPYLPITETQDRHIFSTSFAYTFAKAFHQRILSYERSLTLSYYRTTIGSRTSALSFGTVYSLNDYFMPTLSVSKDFNSGKYPSIRGGLQFQSPSRCWKLDTSLTRRLTDDPDKPGYEPVFTWDLTINLTGSGFSGVTEAPGGVTK